MNTNIPTIEGQDVTVEPWGSIKYLLDNCPYSIRSRYKGGAEDLTASLAITFIAMRDELTRLKKETAK